MIELKRIVEVKFLHTAISEEDLSPKTPGSAGIDLVAATFYNHDVAEELGYTFIQPGEVAMIGTGIAVHISDPGYAGLVLPRSGLGNKGLVLGNLVGLIDSDYQGEIKVSAWNRSDDPIQIKRMDRIAQLILVPVLVPHFKVVSEFAASLRGEGGFGSTGVSAS